MIDISEVRKYFEYFNYSNFVGFTDDSLTIEDIINYSLALYILGKKNVIYVEDILKFLSIATEFYNRYGVRFIGIVDAITIDNKLLSYYNTVLYDTNKKQLTRAHIKNIISKVEDRQSNYIISLKEKDEIL